MRALTPQEKRTLRIAGIVVGIYLVCFGGWKVWGWLEKKRADYQQVLRDAKTLKQTLQPFEARIEHLKALMENFHVDPAKLSKKTLLAEASAAIQKAAMGSGLQVGPVREPPARSSSTELTLQFEATGPVQPIMGLVGRLETIGYPLIIDTLQITPESSRPGQVKLSLTIVILDFEQWKEAKPNA